MYHAFYLNFPNFHVYLFRKFRVLHSRFAKTGAIETSQNHRFDEIITSRGKRQIIYFFK